MSDVNMLDISVPFGDLDAQLDILVDASDELIESLSRDDIARIDERVVGFVNESDGQKTLLLQVDFMNAGERATERTRFVSSESSNKTGYTILTLELSCRQGDGVEVRHA